MQTACSWRCPLPGQVTQAHLMWGIAVKVLTLPHIVVKRKKNLEVVSGRPYRFISIRLATSSYVRPHLTHMTFTLE